MIEKDETSEVIKCPICGKVLFVKHKETSGKIDIKCLRCKQISQIELKKN